MILKTYGVAGLMDFTTQIKIGKATLSVHFTGGALTAYGVTPAKYSTSNPFIQHVIENCEQYRNGRIHLVDTMEVPDDKAAIERKSKLAAKKSAAGTTENQSLSEKSEPVSEEANEEKPNMPMVSVTDKPDAIEYLKEHFPEKGFTATKLRTDAAFLAACEECGVQFTFTS